MLSDPFDFLNEHISVSRETFGKLSSYYQLLLKWQPKINLVGPDTIDDSWRRHFLDSLQIIVHIKNKEAKIVDLGSGAGFPGLVLAVAGHKNVNLIESDIRKATFMREVSRITDSKVTLYNKRIEEVSINGVNIITSRACASLHQLLQFSSQFVSHETFCLFHKGKNYSKDIEEAREHWMFEMAIFPSVSDPEGVILKIEKLKGKKHDEQQP